MIRQLDYDERGVKALIELARWIFMSVSTPRFVTSYEKNQKIIHSTIQMVVETLFETIKEYEAWCYDYFDVQQRIPLSYMDCWIRACLHVRMYGSYA